MNLTIPMAALLAAGLALASCTAPPEPAPPQASTVEPSTTYPTPGQKFVQAKLEELEAIRQTPEFATYGFAVGGPYDGWSAKLDKDIETQGLAMWEAAGINMIQSLGLHYVAIYGPGQPPSDNDIRSAEEAKQRIMEVINYRE